MLYPKQRKIFIITLITVTQIQNKHLRNHVLLIQKLCPEIRTVSKDRCSWEIWRDGWSSVVNRLLVLLMKVVLEDNSRYCSTLDEY